MATWPPLQDQSRIDMAYYNGTEWVRVPAPTGGASRYFLTTDNNGFGQIPPAWAVIGAGNVPLLTEANITPESLTNGSLANRTRLITLAYSGGATATTVDAHGGVIGSVPHVDVANGATTQLWWLPLHMPADYVASSSVTVNIRFSSDVAGGSWAFQTYMAFLTSGTTGQSQVSDGGAARSCNATANTPNDYAWAVGAIPGTMTMYVFIINDRGSILDDNTGVVSIWDVWLSYTADM